MKWNDRKCFENYKCTYTEAWFILFQIIEKIETKCLSLKKRRTIFWWRSIIKSLFRWWTKIEYSVSSSFILILAEESPWNFDEGEKANQHRADQMAKVLIINSYLFDLFPFRYLTCVLQNVYKREPNIRQSTEVNYCKYIFALLIINTFTLKDTHARKHKLTHTYTNTHTYTHKKHTHICHTLGSIDKSHNLI